MGVAPNNASLNDVEQLEAIFTISGKHWREYADRPADRSPSVRALWLQATRGDCERPRRWTRRYIDSRGVAFLTRISPVRFQSPILDDPKVFWKAT